MHRPPAGLNPVEQVVEGAKEASALVVDKVLQHVPGTAEHALRRDLKEMEAAQQQRQEQQAGQAGPKHVVFQEGGGGQADSAFQL